MFLVSFFIPPTFLSGVFGFAIGRTAVGPPVIAVAPPPDPQMGCPTRGGHRDGRRLHRVQLRELPRGHHPRQGGVDDE